MLLSLWLVCWRWHWALVSFRGLLCKGRLGSLPPSLSFSLCTALHFVLYNTFLSPFFDTLTFLMITHHRLTFSRKHPNSKALRTMWIHSQTLKFILNSYVFTHGTKWLTIKNHLTYYTYRQVSFRSPWTLLTHSHTHVGVSFADWLGKTHHDAINH